MKTGGANIALRAVTSSRPLGFLSPRTGGTEGGVKTIEERLGEKGGAFFNGKEGRDDFRTPFFNGKEGQVGFRKNHLNIFRKASFF